jgi:hypothetical protein
MSAVIVATPVKPCRKNPEAVKCAVRHRRCPGCPYNNFFKKEETTKIKEKRDK